MPTVYVSFDDKKRGKSPKTFYQKNESEFKKLNDEGWGIYFSVNEFYAENLKPGETMRQDKYLKSLRYAYADLDIAKSGSGESRALKTKKKMDLLSALLKKCEPTMVIDTSNGLQPLWAITENEPTEENKARYIKILKGIVAWSKTVGCSGDNVYDTARILRLVGYYHQKEEPYLCDFVHKSNKKYSLSELEQIFPFHEEPKAETVPVSENSNPAFKAIEELDIKELIIKAFASVGRPVTFDKSGRMIDPVGGTTGTFIGRKGERDYLASTSHEPFKGNKITAVAEILKVDYSVAYQWICKEYQIDFKRLMREDQNKKVIEKLKTIPVKKEYPLRYTWGTRELDISLAIIKRGNFIVAAAKSGSGKTTFVFDMACKNARLGHKVLFLSLEMDEKDILEDFGRKYAGITIEEELDYKIPESKQRAFERRVKEIKDIHNLKIQSVRRSGDIQWGDIEEIIKNKGETDLVFIDNLDLIAAQDKENDVERQKRIVKSILNFTALTKIPIVLIHHYRKSGTNGKDMGLDDMSGSGKIRDGADRIIKITRNTDIHAEYPEKYMTTIYLQKGRGYPEAMRNVYFIKGTFVDTPPFDTGLQEIAETLGGEVEHN